jgi:hypothetical protein
MGRHRLRLTNRGRAGVAALTVFAFAVLLVASGAVAQLVSRGDGLVRPTDACASPPAMQRSDGVTLHGEAMRAFKRAERMAGRRIDVVQSYRSCSQQALACERICGDPNGCPGTCARPGSSYHQLGAAIDVGERMLQAPGVVAALEEEGWCQSVPDSDPGHFSFGGCH